MAEAACRGMDVNIFFTERGDVAGVRRAKAVCEGCPVQAECLAYALRQPHSLQGIWGGKAMGPAAGGRSAAAARAVKAEERRAAS